jgi:hypothetical protein
MDFRSLLLLERIEACGWPRVLESATNSWPVASCKSREIFLLEPFLGPLAFRYVFGQGNKPRNLSIAIQQSGDAVLNPDNVAGFTESWMGSHIPTIRKPSELAAARFASPRNSA